MLRGLEPSRATTCMLCRRAAARYYGRWADEGLCRPCIEKMEPELRFRILHDMNPEDRKRWQLDNRYSLETLFERPDRRSPRGQPQLADALVRAPAAAPVRTARMPGTAPQAEGARQERRRTPRMPARLPASLWGLAPQGGHGPTRGRAFHARSRDVSLGGIRVAGQDSALLELRPGSHLRLELLLPKPSVILRCGATVRSVVPSRESPEAGSLGLAFHELNLGQEATLRQFLAGGPATP